MLKWDKNQPVWDIASLKSGAPLPEDISNTVDVLNIAQTWSLFMSADIPSNDRGFQKMSQYLIKDSYLYTVAYKWVNSIDYTFISKHTLQNPAFTNVTIENYKKITDTCFSVDIGFNKNMIVLGAPLVNTMHSTFTFVKYNDQWKLVQIKEIVE